MSKEIEYYGIVAFKVPEIHSKIYRPKVSRERLHEAIDKALNEGANVISIRRVEE